MRILFWNVFRKDLTGLVCCLAETTQADVIILNENVVNTEGTLSELRRLVSSKFFSPVTSMEKRFQCFCKNEGLGMNEVHSGSRTSVREMCTRKGRCLLALIHGVDVINYDDDERLSYAQLLSDELRFARNNWETNQLIAIGDFNMNPFDRGMNLATGLNAMMTRACASAGTRSFLDKKFDLYYNPMWGHLGDLSPGPAGTIYDTSRRGPFGWSMFDQVIISHSLIEFFSRVDILSTAGKHPLLDASGHPDRQTASDHLPILLGLREELNG